MRKVWVCDACQHEWLTGEYPKRCARCKSRKWNSGGGADVDARTESLATGKPKAGRKGVGSVASTLGEDVSSKPVAVMRGTITKEACKQLYPDAGLSNLERHDPKSCRLYKCGLCRGAGVKDSHRGL